MNWKNKKAPGAAGKVPYILLLCVLSAACLFFLWQTVGNLLCAVTSPVFVSADGVRARGIGFLLITLLCVFLFLLCLALLLLVIVKHRSGRRS